MKRALRTGTLSAYATCTGTHACESPVGIPKPGGMTPTSVYERLLSIKARPSADGSLPRCVRQKPSLTTTAGAAPGASSGGVSQRPRAGFTPNVPKRFPVTTAACTCTGPCRPVRSSGKYPYAPIASRVRACSRTSLASAYDFHVPAELEPHGGQHAVLEFRLSARAEALIERGGENGHGYRLVDGGLDRPASLARVRDPAGEFREGRILHQRGCRQIEQPRGDHAATPPHLGDLAQIEIVLVVLRVPQRRRLGVDRMRSLSRVGAVQDAQAFGIRRHDAVLDSVVNHLDERAGAVRSAVEIALLGGAAHGRPTRSARDVAGARCQPQEDRIEVSDHRLLAPDHQAIAALQPPDAAAGPDVHVVDALLSELSRTPDVVDVIGITAVDEDVAGREMRNQFSDGRVHGRRRDHQPDGPRRLQLPHQIGDRRGT